MIETGSIMGYEYGYRFWMDKSIIERFDLRPNNIKYVFERRTNFVVKRSDGGGGDEIVDSERVEFVGWDGRAGEGWLYKFWYQRLEDDYWMSGDEVRELVRKAVDFARQKQKELADVDDVSLPFIPIVVELDVCTVQKAGEPISDAYGRALRPQHLYPLSLRVHDNLEDGNDFLHLPVDDFRFEGLVSEGIDQISRVMDVDFRVCRLCTRKATIGALIVSLEGCFHRFHHHCIAEWLLKYEKSCPTCRRHVTCDY